LLDHVTQRTIDLGSVEIVVLDEADRMLDMGFIRDIRRILALLPLNRQNLLFSATFANEIRQLAAGFLHDPAQVQIARRNSAVELIRQVVYPVDRERKRELLRHLIRSGRIDQALVFTRTKHGANRLAEQLARDGIAASAIHGNKSQPQRVRALQDFKAGRVAILVATEIAARGLDIDGLPHVVNFELPLVAQDYVHRIGRTGRAGLEGDAVSLVCVDEAKLLREIEDVLRHPIPVEVVPGFEVDRSIRPESIRRGPVAGGALAGGRRPMSRDGRGPGGPAWGGGTPARQRGRRAAGYAGPMPGTGIGHRPAQSNPGRPIASMRRPDGGATLPGERFGPRPQTTAHTPPFGRPSTTMKSAGRTIGAPARSEVGMAKHSKHERERRSVETERVKEIESAWVRSLPADRAAAFVSSVEAARSRGPQPRQPDMAPGTQPRPPRPGHEPRPPKEAPRSRRSY
jgi:ATP-dependent RNA helicase RhlE